MGIDEVKAEIIDNARSQAKAIIKEAEKERESLIGSAEIKIKEIKQRIEQETDIAIDQYKSMVLAETSSFSKKQKLLLEKCIIDEVFEKAKIELKDLNSKKRENHLNKIIKSSGDFKFSKVYCSKKDIPALKKYSPSEIDILGGVILEDKDGEKRVDISYETLLDTIKRDSLSEISATLFK